MKKEKNKNIIIGGLSVLLVLSIIANLLTLNWTKSLANNKIDNNESSNTQKETDINKDEKLENNEENNNLPDNKNNNCPTPDKKEINKCITTKVDGEDVKKCVNTKNDVVSISIFSNNEVVSIPNIEIYNFYSNQIITSTKLLELFNISESEFQAQLKTQYLAFFDKDTKEYIEAVKLSGYDVEREKQIIKTVRSEIEKMTFNAPDYNMYINTDGNIEFIISNYLWVSRREIIEMREVGSEDYVKIVIK